MDYGLLVDYKWCTGCHSCEVACQQVHEGYAPTSVGGSYKLGIKLHEIGPYDLGDNKFQWEFIPVPTAHCDLCWERTSQGRLPACVVPCQGACLHYGTIEELSHMMTSDHMVLFR